jgi:glycosyltransferase involved in cell wall biosynthesis
MEYKMIKNISVVTCVFNEEKRIERFLKSFIGFDEIIVFDKSSTDNTVAICKSYNAKVISIPYSDRGDIGKPVVQIARNNWLLLVTASDIIHPELKEILIALVNGENFEMEVIYVPYMIHCHGINSKHSVHDSDYRPCLVKKDVIDFNDRVHEELSINSTKIMFLPKSRNIAIHHLTHQNMDSSFERGIRYTKEELKNNYSLLKCLKNMIRVIFLGIKKRFWKIGWDGLAMMLLLLNYHIMIFLRVWEKKRNFNVESFYDELAKKL